MIDPAIPKSIQSVDVAKNLSPDRPELPEDPDDPAEPDEPVLPLDPVLPEEPAVPEDPAAPVDPASPLSCNHVAIYIIIFIYSPY